jgi:hypothetical protein
MIYRDIGQNVPPATQLPIIGEPTEPIVKVWNVLNTCWDIHPERRPSAVQVQEFVTGHWDRINAVLGEGFMVVPDWPI